MSQTVTKLTASSLAALLCARICHDLVSPVGALTAALEVFDDENSMDMREDAIALIKLSAGQASAKLQFLRLAFGAGGSAPGIIPTSELKTLAMGVFGDGKAEIIWDTQASGLDKTAARLLLNLIMLGVQAVPRGGSVTVNAVSTAENSEINIICTGDKSRLADTVVKTLAGGAPEDGFDGRSVQPFYAGLIAREVGGKASASMEGDTVTFTASLPNTSGETSA